MTNRLTDGFRGASMFLTSDQARIYNRLAQYEDTGLTPDEIAALKADRDQWQDGTIIVKLADAEAEIERLCAALKLAQARAGDLEDEIAALRAELDAIKARWTETASDNTDYTLSHLDGIYAVSDPNGSVVCEFIHAAALEGGQHGQSQT